MKQIYCIFSALFLGIFSIQAQEETSEHIRESEERDLPRIHSAVLPLDSQEGTVLDPLGENADKFSGQLPWFNKIKKSRGKYITIENGIPNYDLIFENAIIAFGSSAGGSPLYVDQSYKFGIAVGTAKGHKPENSAQVHEILISAYPKSAFKGGENNITPTHRIPISIPEEGTKAWSDFITGGVEVQDQETGLNIALTSIKDQKEAHGAASYALTLHASQPNYYFKVEALESHKIGNIWYPAVKSVNENDRPTQNVLFTVDFDAADTTETPRKRIPRRVTPVSHPAPISRPAPIHRPVARPIPVSKPPPPRVNPVPRVETSRQDQRRADQWQANQRADQQRQDQRRADQRAEQQRQNQQRQDQRRADQLAERQRQEQRRADERAEQRRENQRRQDQRWADRRAEQRRQDQRRADQRAEQRRQDQLRTDQRREANRQAVQRIQEQRRQRNRDQAHQRQKEHESQWQSEKRALQKYREAAQEQLQDYENKYVREIPTIITRDTRAKKMVRTIDQLRASAAAEKWPSWLLEYHIRKTAETEIWHLGWMGGGTLERRLQPILDHAIRGLVVGRTEENWEPWAIEHGIEILKEEHEWHLWNVTLRPERLHSREPRLRRLAELKIELQNKYRVKSAEALEARLKAVREKGAAEKWPSWLIEYALEANKEDHEWAYHVRSHNVSRQPRFERLANLKTDLENAYEEKATKERETRLQAVIAKGAAEKWAPWAIENEIERIEEAWEWEYYADLIDESREARLQRVKEENTKRQNEYNTNATQALERRLQAVRAAAGKWPAWQIEYALEANKEDHEWEYYVQYQNVSRQPRVEKLLETKIRLYKAAAEKQLAWQIEYGVEALKEGHEWEYYVQHQNIPRQPRVEKLLETRIRLFKAYAAAQNWSWDDVEGGIAALNEDHEWQYYTQYQNIPREPRLRNVLETKIQLFRKRASQEKWIPWYVEYRIAEMTEDFEWWNNLVNRQIESRESRLQKLAESKKRLESEYHANAAKALETKLQSVKDKNAAEKWPAWQLAYELEANKEAHEWEYYVQYQNVSRDSRLEKLLETKIQLFQAHATAQNWLPWNIEYHVAEMREDFDWTYKLVDHQNESRESRLQKLAELKKKLESEYHANAAEELEAGLQSVKRRGAAEKWPTWEIEYFQEVIKEEFEWLYHVQYQNIPRQPRWEKILETTIRSLREYATAEKWPTWQIESGVVELTEDFQWWRMGVKDQNVSREPRLQKVLENEIRLFKEYATANSWLTWQIESGVAELIEDFEWWKMGVKEQNVSREPRLQKLKENKIRLFREYATAESWLAWQIEANVEVLKEDFERWNLEHQTEPREQRLQRILGHQIRFFREHALAEKWLEWEIESAVAELTEDFQWQRMGVKDQNIPREPRLQNLLETKIRLFKEHALAEKWLEWEIESAVAELTEDFQWQRMGVKDQNIPREPRLQKLREQRARREQEHHEKIAREEAKRKGAEEIANLESGRSYKNTTGFAGLAQFVSDPVNVITGEFYICDVDFTLAGPFSLEIGRNYSSQKPAEGEFGYGWKMSCVPYLVPSPDGTMFYATETDGSVIVYSQDPNNTNRWIPMPEKNPHLNNVNGDSFGSSGNTFNSFVTKLVEGSDVSYVLNGAAGDKKTFTVQQLLNGKVIVSDRPYLKKWEDKNGNYYTFHFGLDSQKPDYQNLAKIVSSNGNEVRFTYNDRGYITETSSGTGEDERRVRYLYSADGDLIKVTRLGNKDPENIEVAYEYSQHQIIREQKPDGRILVNEYDDKNRVKVQKATVGDNGTLVQNASFTYDNTQELDKTLTGSTEVEDAFNKETKERKKTRYDYVKGLITKITDPLGQTIEQEWYQVGDTTVGAYPRSLKERKDQRGLISQYQYDTKGNLIEKRILGDITGDKTSDIAVTKFAYNNNNLLTSVTDPLGNEIATFYEDTAYPWLPTRIEHKVQGLVISTINNTYYQVNANGKVMKGLLKRQCTGDQGSEQGTIEYTYNDQGFLESQKQTTGLVEQPQITHTFTHNSWGELTKQIDAAGISTYTYNLFGKPTLFERRDKANTLLTQQSTTYNRNGEPERMINGPSQDPASQILLEYDKAGRIQKRQVQVNRVDNDVQASGSDAYAQTTYKHDAFGNLVEVVEPGHQVTKMVYDGVGRMLTRVRYDSSKNSELANEKFTYEKGGKVATYTNPLGGETKYSYTADGKLCRQENPDGTIQEWQYNLDGRLTKEIQTNGSYWHFAYNDKARTATRTLKSSSGETLSRETSVFDVRGNLVSFTDAEINTFHWTYDQLGRLKDHTGPRATAGAFQQTNTVKHPDEATSIVTNSLGEKTITTRDALDRTTSIVIQSGGANNTIRKTAFFYDKNKITKVEGTLDNAIKTVIHTDSFGNPLLKIANNTKQKFKYDLQGNLISFINEEGHETVHTRDALGRLLSTTLPGGATVHYTYDAASNLLSKTMPGQLTWSATYDKASRLVTEELTGNGEKTRERKYTYHENGTGAGKIKSIIDGRGLIHEITYNNRGQIENIQTSGAVSGSQKFSYNIRGFLEKLSQKNSENEVIDIFRDYSPYGEVIKEIVTLNGKAHQIVDQNWNAAGRRTGFSLWEFHQQFKYRADGLLEKITLPTQNQEITYTYQDNGLLIAKNSGSLNQSFSRDLLGRIHEQQTKAGGNSFLTENLAWNANATPSNYTSAYFGGSPQVRKFGYNDRGQLLTEGTALGSTTSYNFDASQSGNGLGIRTKAARQSVTKQDAWSRIQEEFTDHGERSIPLLTGNTGAPEVKLILNGLTLGTTQTVEREWACQIGALKPGKYQLQAIAMKKGISQMTATSDFTVEEEPHFRMYEFDGEGNLTKTVTSDDNDEIIKRKDFTWDAQNRLTKVTERDEENNGYDWSAVFDGLGRRLQTTYIPVLANKPITEKIEIIRSYFDPEVEFLEVGVKVNDGPVTWKAYGVDKDGTYGGLQGIGGLEAIITPTKTYSIINDAFGNVVATHDGTEAKKVPTQVGAYGPLPGSLALPLSSFRGLEQVTHWLGKRLDETGLIWLGARYYNPDSGRFISPDPYGHFGSWDLYSYANGNPIAYCDPTGRLGKGMFQGAALGDNFTPENTAQGIGKFIGQVGMALVPYAGQVATMVGLTGDAQWDFTSGASLAMAGGAFKPGVSNTAKSGVKALHGAPASTAAIAEGAGQGPVIIGETMVRVEAAAAKYPGAKILNDMPDFAAMGMKNYQVTSAMMQYNRSWILQQMKSGRAIIDIGADANRAIPSIFYQMEQNMLKNYQKLNPQFTGAIRL